LFIHAWSGCDTTYATFGHGKTILLKKIQVPEEVQQILVLMSDPHMTADELVLDSLLSYLVANQMIPLMFCDKPIHGYGPIK